MVTKYDDLGSPGMRTPQKSSATARLLELEAQVFCAGMYPGQLMASARQLTSLCITTVGAFSAAIGTLQGLCWP